MVRAGLAGICMLSMASSQKLEMDLNANWADSTIGVQNTQSMYVPDRWFARDKAYHFIGGFVGAMVLSISMPFYFDTPRERSPAIASAGMFCVGALKETYDSREPKNHFCWKDMTSNILGIVAGALFYMTVSGDKMGR